MIIDPGWGLGPYTVIMDVQNVDLANGQQHIVRVTRSEQGLRMKIEVRKFSSFNELSYVSLMFDSEFNLKKSLGNS